jgi:hypothetical protein
MPWRRVRNAEATAWAEVERLAAATVSVAGVERWWW